MVKRKLGLLVMLVLCIAAAGCAATQNMADSGIYRYTAEIVDVSVSTEENPKTGSVYIQQEIKTRPLEGPYEGQVFDAFVSMEASDETDVSPYRTGDRVTLDIFLDENGEVMSASVINLIRWPYVAALAGLLLLLVGVIGRKKGLKTILSLVFTLGAIILILVPSLSKGADPVAASIFTNVAIAVFSLFLVGGFNRKSLAAVLATAGGLIFAGLVTWAANALMRVSVIELEEVEMLVISNVDVAFNLQGLIVAAILIGCLGAVMDVSMSIASVVSEVAEADPEKTAGQLFASGLSVGRDMMGTMANTLILAYTGGSLLLMVAWNVYGVSFADMLNSGYIVLEVVKAICGSIGMILTIPLAAWISSALIKGRRQGQKKQPEIWSAQAYEGTPSACSFHLNRLGDEEEGRPKT